MLSATKRRQLKLHREADMSRKIADQTKKMSDYQERLHKEQESETRKQQDSFKKLQDSLFQQQKDNERGQRRTLSSLAARSLASRRPLLASDVEHVNSGIADTVIHDAFISHASEDKDEIVRPLAQQLVERGFNVWYDDFQLRIGDGLRRSIDRGLSASRFGIVILSEAFFQKEWPQRELDGLVAREVAGGKVILPIWHKISKDRVMSYSPTLADKLALNTSVLTVAEIVDKLAEAITPL